jgi:hypothetical protein
MIIQISRIILSFLFVFGAISKLISMPFFDGMVAELILGQDYFNQPKSMVLVQWLTRILVAIELWIGIALLQNKGFKKVTLPLTIVILLLFTAHLFYDSFMKENGFVEGNCGCFGDVLPMTNLESIIKNVIGLAVAIYTWIKYNNQEFKSWTASVFVGLVTLFTLSFGVKSYQNITEVSNSTILLEDTILTDTIETNFNELQEDSTITEKAVNDELETKSLNTEASDKETPPKNINSKISPKNISSSSNQKSPKTTLDLLNLYAPDLNSYLQKNDTTLVCLFSMTCSHCQEVYRDISSMKLSKKIPPIYLINYGTEYEQNYFFTQAGSKKDPHHRIDDFTLFKLLLEGKTYPRILCITQGKILKEWDVDSYQKEKFMDHFGIDEIIKKQENNGLQLELNQGNSPW